MNLQAKRSVFRSRKSRHPTKGIQSDLATSFLAHGLAVKNRKKEAKDAKREARELARPRRRGGAQVTSSRRPSMNMATAILLGAFAALSRRKSSASTTPLEK